MWNQPPPLYVNNLIQATESTWDEKHPHPIESHRDLGPTQVGHPISSSIFDCPHLDLEEETAKLLNYTNSCSHLATMTDIIDATSEPIQQDLYVGHTLRGGQLSRSAVSPSLKCQSCNENHTMGPSFLSISTTDSENNADFGLEPNDGDQLPLIRGPAQQGLVHRLLRRLGRTKPRSSTMAHLQQSEDDEDMEDSPKSLEGQGSCRPHGPPGIKDVHQTSSLSIGILLASVSCIFFATSSLIVKVSALHPMELLCVRGALQAVLVSPIIISSGNSFMGPKGSRGLLLARATLGSVSLIMAFNSIHLIPLADASTVIFTSPVFVSLFACICIGELCTLFDVSMILLTVLGVVLVSKPSFGLLDTVAVPGQSQNQLTSSWTNMVGIFCGVCAAMLTALAFIVLRQLKHVHYAVTVFWFSVILALFGAVLTVALDGFTLPTTALTLIQCLGIGLCGFLGQILLTKSLQLENAGPVAVARSLDIVLSFFYQISFLHDTPDLYSYIGSALVVACVILTGLRRWYNESRVKKSDDLCTVVSNGHGCRDDVS